MVLWCEKATSASSSDGDSDLQGTQNLLRLKRRKHQVTINKSGFYLVTVFSEFFQKKILAGSKKSSGAKK